jgi:hypothetical protein
MSGQREAATQQRHGQRLSPQRYFREYTTQRLSLD